MKTLSLSSIAFAALCLFSSCTKDSSQLSSQSTDQSTLSARESILGQGKGSGPATNENSLKTIPKMTVTFNPDPATEGQDVTVTGSFAPAPGETAPDCGKWQLKMSTDGSNWINVGQEKLVSGADNTVSYTFKPAIVGDSAYQFQLHYVSSGPGCDTYDGGFSKTFYLNVHAACAGVSLTRELTNTQPAGENLYEFTVVYKVTTCGAEFDQLKLQGGLTNATSIVEAMPASGGQVVYDNWVPGGSKNWIQRWVEKSSDGSLLPTNERTYTVKFTKAYSGSGPIELTGGWSVTLTKAGIEVDRKECDPISIQ